MSDTDPEIAKLYEQACEAFDCALAAVPILAELQGFTPFQQLIVARCLQYELSRLEWSEGDQTVDEWIVQFAAECQPPKVS
jgi:hypothetical protein